VDDDERGVGGVRTHQPGVSSHLEQVFGTTVVHSVGAEVPSSTGPVATIGIVGGGL
jgi:hypothetical protein